MDIPLLGDGERPFLVVALYFHAEDVLELSHVCHLESILESLLELVDQCRVLATDEDVVDV